MFVVSQKTEGIARTRYAQACPDDIAGRAIAPGRHLGIDEVYKVIP